jgi:hypothetical protein
MDALAEVRNEEIRLRDAGLLQSATVLATCSSTDRSSSAHPTAPVPLVSPPVVPPASRGESVGLHCVTVIAMDMWRHSAAGRRKLRRLRLAVLHRVLVVLVLEVLRGVLLVQRHMRFSCYFVALRPLRRQKLLVL